MSVPAFNDPPEVPAETALKLASHAIARRICGRTTIPVSYPLVAEAIYELLDQGVIEIGPHLNG